MEKERSIVSISQLQAYCSQFMELSLQFSSKCVALEDCQRLLQAQYKLDEETFSQIFTFADHDMDSHLDKVEYCVFSHVASLIQSDSKMVLPELMSIDLHKFVASRLQELTISDEEIMPKAELLSDPSIARARPTPLKIGISFQEQNSPNSSQHCSAMGLRNLSSDRISTENELLRLPPPKGRELTTKQSQTLQPGFAPPDFKKGHKRASSMGSTCVNHGNFLWKNTPVSNSFVSSSPLGDSAILIESCTNVTITPPKNRHSSQTASIPSRNEPVTFQDEASNDIEALIPLKKEESALPRSAFRPPDCKEKSLSSQEMSEQDENSSINDSEDSSPDSSVTSDEYASHRPIKTVSYAQAVNSDIHVYISQRADPIQVLSAATGRPGNVIAKLEPTKRRKLLKSLVREAKLMNHILLRLNNELQGEVHELSDQRTSLSAQLQHLGLIEKNP
ncbi:hypothetical protein Ciccas_013413 [Cichlidogyrus casuarinus]|uniref:EF-hand domain-containing protein n=1 Tax=Cichlidogyrus casuarinus TaxID=1844966 RepID=A0ABD2PL58_9PLAT